MPPGRTENESREQRQFPEQRGSHRGAMGDLKELLCKKLMRRKGERRDWIPSNSTKKRKAISAKDKNQFLELSENWREFFSENPDHFVLKDPD